MNTLRIFSENENYECKTLSFRPAWTRMETWEDCLREISQYITIPIVDINLVKKYIFIDTKI